MFLSGVRFRIIGHDAHPHKIRPGVTNPVEPAHLKNISIFRDASPEAIDRLCSVSKLTIIDHEQPLFLEGEKGAPVFFVLEGVVRVFKTNPDGREQTLIQVEAGSPLNLPTVFSADGSAPASAIPVIQTTVLAITQQDFREIVLEQRDIALAILRDMSERVRHLVDLSYDLSLKTVRGRLASFLLDECGEDGRIPEHWTREEIAAHIGSVRVVISRTLGAFSGEGLVKLEGRHIVVLDRRLLMLEGGH